MLIGVIPRYQSVGNWCKIGDNIFFFFLLNVCCGMGTSIGPIRKKSLYLYNRIVNLQNLLRVNFKFKLRMREGIKLHEFVVRILKFWGEFGRNERIGVAVFYLSRFVLFFILAVKCNMNIWPKPKDDVFQSLYSCNICTMNKHGKANFTCNKFVQCLIYTCGKLKLSYIVILVTETIISL